MRRCTDEATFRLPFHRSLYQGTRGGNSGQTGRYPVSKLGSLCRGPSGPASPLASELLHYAEINWGTSRLSPGSSPQVSRAESNLFRERGVLTLKLKYVRSAPGTAPARSGCKILMHVNQRKK